MYIERKLNPITWETTWIIDGEKEVDALLVFLNDKRVAADIKQLDTNEGWIDIEVPLVEKTLTITNESKVDLSAPEVPDTFGLEVKRLTGVVQVKLP